MPSVAPYTSVPSSRVGLHVRHFPARTKASASATRRARPMSSAKAKSAVVSVRTPGVLPTAIRRAVQAATSMLS
jgi:hypothetical protein